MNVIFLTALGVGGATVFGSIVGFLFKDITQRFSSLVLSFAAGVMLTASILGLILPSLEYGSSFIVIIGIFAGGMCTHLLGKAVPYLPGMPCTNSPEQTQQAHSILLFVGAIAIHNFPEGIAAGVGFGTEDISKAIFIAGGIALQNIPEGMVIIGPMLSARISPARTLLYAFLTGMIEIAGTFLGYYAVTIASVILPFALAHAGGTMLYVISSEMIPQTQINCNQASAAYALLTGFCFMLVFSVLLA